jgi:hypothetical protein
MLNWRIDYSYLASRKKEESTKYYADIKSVGPQGAQKQNSQKGYACIAGMPATSWRMCESLHFNSKET